jgi:two-component system chemotaxis response regulator CheB
MMPAKIRTLVIDDSAFMRVMLTDVLQRDGTIEVIATASNGMEGVRKSKLLAPQVIVTDMLMPDYDGLYVVREVMRQRPVPIILLSALDRTDEKIFVALEEGAFDFLDKPIQREIARGCPALTTMIREAATSGYKRGEVVNLFDGPPAARKDSSLRFDILAIGASTGGPGAVESIIKSLPRKLSLPVVIAQHMPARFIESYADRLQSQNSLKVSVARNGEQLLPNHYYVASGYANMRVRASDQGPCVNYVDDPYPEFNCPSADCLLIRSQRVSARARLA